MDNTQLPAEVVERIDKEAEVANRKNKDRVNSYRFGYVAGYNDGANPYATKLHQVEQEVAQLKQWKAEASALLNPILDYGQTKEASIPLGESITEVVLERCKNLHQAKQMLFRLASLVNAEQRPDEKFLTEIKQFLDGKK
jgi:hypothetical protein